MEDLAADKQPVGSAAEQRGGGSLKENTHRANSDFRPSARVGEPTGLDVDLDGDVFSIEDDELGYYEDDEIS